VLQAPSDAKEAVRQLYASADPDVRRAMAKSFSESSGLSDATLFARAYPMTWLTLPHPRSGTTLSMDWKSTGSKRTEFVPPA